MNDISNNQLIDLFGQVSKSTKSIYDLTSRMDERMKLMVAKQVDTDNKIDKIITLQISLSERTTILETKQPLNIIKDLENKIEKLEIETHDIKVRHETSNKNWKGIFDIIVQIFTIVLGAWIVWKMGVK